MAKKKMAEELNEEVEQTTGEVESVEEGTVMARIVKEGDDYFVEDLTTGEKSGPCKFCDENDKTIVLPKNSSNRKWANRKKADEAIAETGEFPLGYKSSRHFGSTGTRIPNEKLIAYLPEELQAEYKAIIDKAIAAREAERAKPLTDLEKAKLKAEKAKAAYEKLMAEAAEGTNN